MSAPQRDSWPDNYFNYFTEVEEHFQKARGAALFLFSPLDWALIESMKNAGVPLEAVLRGIDAAFEKWRARKIKSRAVNSLAFCAQAIAEQAEALAKGGVATEPRRPKAEDSPFSTPELAAYLEKNARTLKDRGLEEIAAALFLLRADIETHIADLEQLEQRLTALEEKMTATARSRMSDADLFAARRELDLQLRPHRGKMTAGQLSMLERQFLDRRVLESLQLPRLSLFFLR